MLVIGFCTTAVKLVLLMLSLRLRRVRADRAVPADHRHELHHPRACRPRGAPSSHRPRWLPASLPDLGFAAVLLLVGATREVVAYWLPPAALPPGVSPDRRSVARRQKSADETRMNAASIRFERLRDATPVPEPELDYASPFELLIAVILSAQATDVSVNLATRRLYPVANTPAKVLALGVEGLTPYIRNIGSTNTKKPATSSRLARSLLERHGGEVTARAQRARGAAGRRPQDGERRAQHRLPASRRSRSTRTCSASPTARASRAARRFARSKTG